MKDNIINKYYKPHKLPNEDLKQTINRIDNEYIENNFNWRCNRDIDIFEKEYINGGENLGDTKGARWKVIQGPPR